VRSFLGFARGESGLFVRVPANDIAKNAVRLVGHRFAASDVELALELADGDGAAIACEPPLFEQVLVNLLVNALEASAAGQRVTLRVEQTEDETSFAVTDEGSGIPASVMERVTEPFFTTKARSGGTGLGLTIAREIVVHHRGELAVNRRQRADGATAGTEVVVRVPRLGAA
jgi:signal transduction histidine kinase